MQLQLFGDQSVRILGRQLLLHLPHWLPKLPGLYRFFSHPDISFKIEMCLPCQGGQGCFDIDECTLSEGVSLSSPEIVATYHLISNPIFFLMKSSKVVMRSSKSLSTASPMHKTYQINYCGPNTNCNNHPGTSNSIDYVY